ncbi:uncharacterized protein LOC129968315 [Argiope bruennichi]|uniref:uncharacterized protein LOC129968315 n=1 Tax=Argiope bruennichi TaxID=94029 RepID=UPI0024955AB1|nr:uncharacterized protein LOC129968315 [Argiope bruennichi]
MATTCCHGENGRLLVTDQLSERQFLIDTGSDFYVFPQSLLPHRKQDSDFQLNAANNSTIKTYGFLTLSLNLGLRRCFSCRFVIANVPLPVIGSDFLVDFGLLPDCRNKLLLDTIKNLSTKGHSTNRPPMNVKIISAESITCNDILREFPTLTRPAGNLRNFCHSTVHHMRTTQGPPVFCRPQRLAPERLKIAKTEFEAMVVEGTSKHGEGPWASPLHLMSKKSGG